MSKRGQVLELFFSQQGQAWRLYAAGWLPPWIRQKLDRNGEAYPIPAPDLADLESYMWSLDTPYEKAPTTLGGVSITGRGRSAVALWEWLYEYLDAAATQR